MQEHDAQRREMIRVGRLLYHRQLIVATEGNLSVRLNDDLFLVTPAGACKGFLAATNLLMVSRTGHVSTPVASASSSAGLSPSTEWPLHQEIYRVRSDVHAICHAHPPWATAFAAAQQPLDGCLLPEVIATLGVVPLARYGTPGTQEVPTAVRDLVSRHDALLLANHGVVTMGASLIDAYFKMESVERMAQVTLLARLAGGERRLTADQARAVRAMATRTEIGSSPQACIPGADDEPAVTSPGLSVTAAANSGELDNLVDRLAQEILSELRDRS